MTNETKHTPGPWPFLQAPLKPAKDKAREERERIAKLPDALL